MEVKKVEVTSVPKILTVNQLANIVGVKKYSIYTLTGEKSKITGEPFLDICYPFPDTPENPISGPKFIVRNEKCEKYIAKCLRRNKKAGKNKKSKPVEKLDTFMLDPKDLIKKYYKHYLGRIVEFDEYSVNLAKEVCSIFTKEEIENAFINLSKSFHNKNGFKVFTLEYFLKPDQISKWSKIK